MKPKTNIDDVRQELLATLRDLRNRDNPMDIERAKAVATVATVLVDSARAENEYLRLAGLDSSSFMNDPDDESEEKALPNGIKSITTHRLGR